MSAKVLLRAKGRKGIGIDEKVGFEVVENTKLRNVCWGHGYLIFVCAAWRYDITLPHHKTHMHTVLGEEKGTSYPFPFQ